MTKAQVEVAEQRMQQQWHDLVMAEQAGQTLEVLEQMYDSYILLAEEYNACMEEYQRQKQERRINVPARRSNNSPTGPVLPHRNKKQQDAKLAS